MLARRCSEADAIPMMELLRLCGIKPTEPVGGANHGPRPRATALVDRYSDSHHYSDCSVLAPLKSVEQ
jgi:hypothetical protein